MLLIYLGINLVALKRFIRFKNIKQLHSQRVNDTTKEFIISWDITKEIPILSSNSTRQKKYITITIGS